MNKKTLNLTIIVLSFWCSIASAQQQRWPLSKAKAWYATKPWLVGANYTPAYAINQLEFWQAETFDSAAIEHELSLAQSIGMNTMRVYLHHVAWQESAAGFKSRVNQFLGIAHRHKIKVIFVLLDDCWNDVYHAGIQPLPKPGIHNSRWLKDPGNRGQTDQHLQDTLKLYVQDMLRSFGKDRRILLWDLYNEPGQFDQHEKSLPLLQQVFAWARAVHPAQPLTSAMYDDAERAITHFQLTNSDIITYHSYDSLKVHQRRIDSLRQVTSGRPLICTEYMARKRGSTFQLILPMLHREKIGALNWGLVDGKTQTKYAWDEPLKDGSEPKLRFHDIFRKDGKPYDPEETQLIYNLSKKHPKAAKTIAK